MARIKKTKALKVNYSIPGSKLRKKIARFGALFDVVSLGIILFLIFGTAKVITAENLVGSILVMITVLVLSFAYLFAKLKDQIVLSETGMGFPACFFKELKGCTSRNWNDVANVQILTGDLGLDSPVQSGATSVKISFFSGGSATLQLSRFDSQGINSLVSSLEEWATRSKITEHLVHLPRLHEVELAGGEDMPTYTQIWEQELKDSYSFTTYVPLRQNQTIRNDSLTVIDQVSAGGFSAVYLVETDKNERYVLKESVVPEDFEETKEKVREHFQREARLLMKLNHPGIVQVIDHFVEFDKDYLLLEYVSGKPLRNLIEKEMQEPQRVIEWAGQLAEVMKYLHEQEPPVIHRDITPDNLITDDKGCVKLIDFGAANEFVGQATGTLVGKQSYMPPEQIRGKCTTQSDIYSYGATIHYLLTGQDPEPLSSSSPKSLNDSILDAVDKLVRKCTNLEMDDRYETIDDVIKELKLIEKQMVSGVSQ